MNKNIILFLTLSVLLCFWTKTQAEPLPSLVAGNLQHHELALSHSDFNWNVAVTEQDFGISPEKAQHLRKASEKDWESRYRQQGMTDKEQIRKYAQMTTDSILKSMESGTVKYSDTWTFDRNGQRMLVNGSVQSITDIVDDYIQFYNEDKMFLACNKSHSTQGTPLRVEDPTVWQTPGESVRYPSPIPAGLDLAPEHFIMLTGLTPLEDRGLQWSNLPTAPTFWKLKSQISPSSAGPGITIVLTLSRKYDNLPVNIQIKHFGWSEEFQSKSFRRYRNEWIIDNAVYKKTIPKLLNIYQVWHLQSVTDSKPNLVKLAHINPVHDYRLLGPNLSLRKIMIAERQHNRDIVYYSWSGSIPDSEQFNTLYQKQHPGEASPDVGQNNLGASTSTAIMISSAMPFAGGVMLLTGGVWMFKQRRAN